MAVDERQHICQWCGKQTRLPPNPGRDVAYCDRHCQRDAYEYRRDMRRLEALGNDGKGSPK